MGTKARNRFSENYESLSNNESSDPVRAKKTLSSRCATTLCRPLRIFQFLTTMLLFALIIFMTAKSAMSEPIHLSHPASILMIILTTSYLFFIAIDIISQFGGHGLPDSPMLLFSFLGVLLFAIAGALLIHYRDPEDNLWALILSQVLCFVISILFLIEITLFIAYWRQKCLSWKKCYPFTPSGTCGQSEIKTIFARGTDLDIDIELGRCNLATSVSRCAIPLETTADSAITDHGSRKVSIGHRREYVDCQSSVPALAIVHTAQIQTDTGRTAITESQTARPEMIESMIQTTSRCELCNRQMEGVAPSPSISSPPPSPESHSRYYSVIPAPVPQIQSPISQIQASVQQMPIETIPYNVPQPSISPNPQIQRGNCAICPAIYHMMGGGIPLGTNPCCQSCNCGVKTPEQPRQAVPYLLEQSAQQVQSASQSDWSEQQASTSTMTKPLIENESFAATPSIPEATTTEVAHGGSNLVVNESNRYKPIKKLPRVYETRPCPTHGSGLAARMAGLPEMVTKVTLSTICFRRNKRTQTRVKKGISSEIPGDIETERVEEDSFNRNYVEKPEASKSQDFQGSIGRFRNEKDNLRSRTVSDARVRMISEEEARRRSRDRRKSGSSLPIKPIRDSGVLLEEIHSEPEEGAANMERMQERKSERIASTKPESSGKLLWQSAGSEPRISVPMEKYSSWLRKDFAIREEADAEKSRQSPERDNRESRITFREKPATPEDSDFTIREEEPSDSDSSMVIGKRSKHIRETISHQASKIGSTPASRLQLENTPEDSKSSRFRVDESSGAIPRAKSRSVSKMRASKADSEVSSDVASRNRSIGKIGKADSEAASRSRISRMTIERSSKADSDMPSISKNRLNKESSRIASKSRNAFSNESSETPLGSKIRPISEAPLSSKIRPISEASQGSKIRPISEASQSSKIRPISEHSELSSRSVVRSATKERLSKKDSESALALAKRSLSKEDPEISSGSERPSKISTDMRLSARDRLGKEDSEKSSRSIAITKSRERSSKPDTETPSDSRTKMEESHLRLESDREDSRRSKGCLRKKDSGRSSDSTIELLSGAESDTPSESETVIDESLSSLKKSIEYDSNSKQRVGTSGSLIGPTRSSSRSASKGLADKSESDTLSASRRRRSEVEDESLSRLESNRDDSKSSKDRLRQKDSEKFSRSVLTSRSEEQPSKTDALDTLSASRRRRSEVEDESLSRLESNREDSKSSKDRLRQKDSEKFSRSVLTSRSEEQPSKTDALDTLSASRRRRSEVEDESLSRLESNREDSKSSKDRLRQKDSEKFSRSVLTSRSEEQPSKTDALDTLSASRRRRSEVEDESLSRLESNREDSKSSKDRLRQKDSEKFSRSVLTSRSEEQPSKTDALDTLSASRRRRSEVEDESLSRLESNREDSKSSKDRLRQKDSEKFSRSVLTSRSEEQPSKIDALDTLSASRGRRSEVEDESLLGLESNREDSKSSKDRLRQKDSEKFSRSVLTSRSEEQPSKTDALDTLSASRRRRREVEDESLLGLESNREDSKSSKDRLRKKDSEKFSRSVFSSRSEEQPSKTDALTPSNSKSGVEESRLGLKYDRNDSRRSKDRLSKEDSEISSKSTIELLNKAESDTPSESQTVIDESLVRLEKSKDDYPVSEERVRKTGSLIVPKRSSSRSASEGLADKLESKTPSTLRTKQSEVSEKSVGKGRSEEGSVVRSSDSKINVISHGSGIKFDDHSESHSDRSVGQRKYTIRRTPYPSKEFIGRDEDSDLEGWRDELAEDLEADESEIFTPSNEISRTKPRKDRSSVTSDSDKEKNIVKSSRRSSAQQNRFGSSGERSPEPKPSETSRKKRSSVLSDSDDEKSIVKSPKRSSTQQNRFGSSGERSPEPKPSETSRKKQSSVISDSDEEKNIVKSPKRSSTRQKRSMNSGERSPEPKPSETSRKKQSSVISDSDEEKNIVKSPKKSSTQQNRYGSSGERSPEPKPSETSRKKQSSVISDSDEEKDIVKSPKRSSTQQNRFGSSGERSPEPKPSETSRKKQSSVISDSDEEKNIVKSPKRSSAQQNRFGSSGERSPEPKPSETSRQQSTKSKSGSSTRPFAYAPASWSSKGNILQSRSRIEQSESRIEADQQKMADCDPYAEMATGVPVPDYCPPTWQCIENPQCTASGMAMDYECVPSVCNDEHICVDPCSCRVKSILLQKCSTGPFRRPVSYSSAERSSKNHYNTETSRSLCPVRELRCPRDVLRCNARKQQQQSTRVNACGSNETKKRMTLNVCYLS